MTCAKQTVRCVLIARNGARIEGTNACANPHAVCPREPGEGYEKCTTICGQGGHAELQALRAALPSEARGAHAYLTGHTYACRECQEALFGAGVAALSIGSAPL
jgi:hypothetical protein